MGAVITVLSHTLKVFNTLRSGNNHSPDSASFPRALGILIPFLSAIAFAFLWVNYSDMNVLENHGRLFIWTFGLFAAILLTKLMISHLTAQKYQPFASKTTVIMFIGMACVASTLSAVEAIPSSEFLSELLVLRVLFVVNLVSYVHLAYGLITEVSQELGICCLTIPYPPKMG